jgi:hypothetical protein
MTWLLREKGTSYRIKIGVCSKVQEDQRPTDFEGFSDAL